MKRLAAVLIAVLLLAAIPAFGQMTGARLSGTVKDPTGAIIVEAKVTIRNQATGIAHTMTTGSNGIYIFRGLEPGSYDLKAERTGFQTMEANGLLLKIGQDMGYDLSLKVGAISEVMNVKAETPLVETQKASVDTVITSEQLLNTPINGRYFLDLLYNSTPGVTGNNNGGLGEGFSVNGQRGYANQFNLDGVTNTNSTMQSVRGRINMDSIQEFQILTHQFEPQYGNASGAVVNVATKGGSNQIHGTAYTFIHDSGLDAQNAYQKGMDIIAKSLDPTALSYKPDNYSRVFGGSAGGPIKTNKLFYFGSYEYSKEIDIHKILAPDEYNAQVPIGPVSGVWSGRIDYTPSEKDTVAFRYNGQRSNGIWGPGGWNTKSTQYREIFQPQSWATNWTHTHSARTLSELRAQFAETLDEGASTENLEFPYVIYRPHSVSGKLPNVPFNVPEYNGQLVYNLSMMRGRHDIKLGSSYMRVVSDGSNKNFGDGEYDFNTDDPFDPTNPWTYPWHYIQRVGKDDWHIPENVFGAFVQDKWSIKDNFTLTYGIRYDFENFFKAVGTLGTLSGRPAQNATKNFAPRIAFAYSPFGPKTVIRGGFGRFYSRAPLNEAALVIQNTVNTHDQSYLEDVWGWNNYGTNQNPIWVPDAHQISYPVPPALNSFHWRDSSVDVFDNNLKYSYTDHYSFGLQRQLSSRFALNVDFVRILGKNLWTMVDRNAPDPAGIPDANGNLPRPNPDYYHITAQASVGHSWYTAMEVTLKHNGRKDSFTLTYTRAKAIDDVRGDPNGWGTTCSYLVNQNPDNIRCDRGLSVNDLPHRVTFDGLYRLPFKFVVSGVFDWHPGYPWTIGAGEDLNGDGWYDRPAGVSRTTQRGTNYVWSQMRFGREFKFGDRTKWEPFVEVFNITNTPSYLGWDGNIRNQNHENPLENTYGKPTGSTGGRSLQWGCRFTF